MQLAGEDFAGGHVVAVGEAAGDGENLVLQEEAWLFAQLVDVDAVGEGAGLLEGELRLLIAVGAGGSQDEGAGPGHAESREESRVLLDLGERSRHNRFSG